MTKTYTVRPLGACAWSGPGLTLKQARLDAIEASSLGLRLVVIVSDDDEDDDNDEDIDNDEETRGG